MMRIDSIEGNTNNLIENKNSVFKNQVNKEDKKHKEVEDYLTEENKEKLKNDINKLNETIDLLDNEVRESLQFKLHEGSDRMMVQVMNIKEHEVIKEMPPEEILDLIGNIKEMVGVFLDEKV